MYNKSINHAKKRKMNSKRKIRSSRIRSLLYKIRWDQWSHALVTLVKVFQCLMSWIILYLSFINATLRISSSMYWVPSSILKVWYIFTRIRCPSLSKLSRSISGQLKKRSNRPRLVTNWIWVFQMCFVKSTKVIGDKSTKVSVRKNSAIQ